MFIFLIKVDVENDDDEEEIKMTKEQRDFVIKKYILYQ